MALQKGKDVFGIAKQSAKGSIAANPTFAHGLAGGGMSIDVSQDPDELTSAYLNPSGAFRDKIDAGVKIETRVWQKAIGLYLLAALGSDVVTGGPAYVHTITLGSALAYLTAFEKKGDATLYALKDCKVDELVLEWDENKPLVMNATLTGGAFSIPATFTVGTDESDTSNYYTPVGGTFKYDVDSATPVTSSVKGGKITIKRSAEAQFFSGAIEAGDVFEGGLEIAVALSVVPDDMLLWKNIVTGSTSGTTLLTVPQYGSFEHTFVFGADSLKITCAHVDFRCDMPEADPKGGAVVSELVGNAYRGATATPITVVLTNAVASY